MKFAVAALLGVTSAALSEKQLIHNQLVSLSGMVSEFDAPEKDAIFNRIAERKDELANQLLAHPEHTESILSEVSTLKGLVRTVDAQNYDGAMSLMEARKEQLKSQLLSLAGETPAKEPTDPTSITFPTGFTDADKKEKIETFKATEQALKDAKTNADKELKKVQDAVVDKANPTQDEKDLIKAEEAKVALAQAALDQFASVLKYYELSDAERAKVDEALKAWKAAYTAWKGAADADKAAKKTALDTAEAEYTKAFTPSGGSSTAFIVIGVVLVLAAAVGGAFWYKKKQGKENEGGEADDRKLYKSQIASVNAHKKAQKVALVDADV